MFLTLVVGLAPNGFNLLHQVACEIHEVPYFHIINSLKSKYTFTEAFNLLTHVLEHARHNGVYELVIKLLDKAGVRQTFSFLKDFVPDTKLKKFKIHFSTDINDMLELSREIINSKDCTLCSKAGMRVSHSDKDIRGKVQEITDIMIKEMKKNFQKTIKECNKSWEAQLQAYEDRLTKVQEKQASIISNKEYIKISQLQVMSKCKIVWIFYQAVQLQLNRFFFALNVLCSGVVKQADTTSKCTSVAETSFKIAGGIVPLPGYQVATTIVLSTRKWIRKKQREKENSEMPVIAVSVSIMEKITEECVRTIAMRYSGQLRRLSEKGVSKLCECTVSRIKAVMLDKIGNATDVMQPDEIVQKLVTGVSSRLDIDAYNNNQIELENSTDFWSPLDIFTLPGICVQSHAKSSYFAGGVTKPGVYGYRLGTLNEVKKLGLTEDLKQNELASLILKA